MLCTLCVKFANSFLSLFNENGLNLRIADIIRRHFCFMPLFEDNVSSIICSSCWSKVDEFHQFYLSVEEAHTALNSMVKNEPEVQSDFSALPEPVVYLKQEIAENICSLTDKTVNYSHKRLTELCEQEIPCSASKEDINDECDSINPFCEMDSGEILNETLKEQREKPTGLLKETHLLTERTFRSRTVSKKSKDPKKVHLKDDSAKKLKGRTSVKSKSEDDAMVKKYIPMICELCPFISEDYSSVTKHFRRDHPNVKAYVKCCNKKLFHRQDIVHHAYRHDNPEFFKCKECQKVFAEQSTLSRHMIAVHASEEELNFHCDQCPKRFSLQKKLELHRNSHVPMAERTFVCDQCPNSRFASNDLLKVHMCMRHRRAPNVCHVCAKEIRDKASFEKHVRAHFEQGGPKVKCPIEDCDHWLKDEHNLRRHIRRVHTIEHKAEKCDICGGVYKNKSALTKHKGRVHTNVVYTCEVCKKNFKRAIYLREHMAQHTGEILYNCQFCTRTFNSNANMHAHKKKMHPVEWDNWRKTNKNCTK